MLPGTGGIAGKLSELRIRGRRGVTQFHAATETR
jgi:hypothetical protein